MMPTRSLIDRTSRCFGTGAHFSRKSFTMSMTIRTGRCIVRKGSTPVLSNRRANLGRSTGETRRSRSSKVVSAMAIFRQLRDHGTANAGHFFPIAVNLLKQMESPTPAEDAAGTAHINNGPSPFLVEAYGGHDDVSARVWIALIETVPPAVLEENPNGVGTHNFIGLLDLELPPQEPLHFSVETVVVGDGVFESNGCLWSHAWLRHILV